MELKFFDKLSQNFTKLLNDKDDYNVIIEVEDKKQFTAHSNIIKCRSPYFCKELDTINPNENNIKTIIKPDISAQILDIILKYIYGGIVNLENIETGIIFDLMLAANKLELEELSKSLEKILIKDKASWLKTHFSLLYRTIFIYNNFKDLENFCNDIVVKYPSLIFDAEDFTSLQESALVSLLKRDDLQVKEVKIWEYIIKWGIAQNPTLPSNLDKWSKDNFLTLKTTLQHCLPYIRYFHIPELDTINPNENNIKTIIKPDISAQILDIILKYIYGGIVNLENIETGIIFDLMLAANKLELEELSKSLEKILIKDKASWLKTHFSLLYRTIFIYNNFKDLENFCNDIVVKYPSLIFDAEDFTSLQESALVSLLKRDDLQVKEVKIWEYIIKWGIAQNPTLSSNLYKWIVLPARTILISELPNRLKELFSTIISDDHAAEISSWIDRKNTIYPSTNYPHEFQLIFQASRNGFAPQTFWNMCHGHAGTVVIVKVKGTDEIIGGYNPLMWDNTSSGYKETKDSFIFSLKNGNIQNSILSRVKETRFAVYYYSKNSQTTYGLCFGCNFYILNNAKCVCSCDSNYEKDIKGKTGTFEIVDYEVFKVKKKTA
ncbi:hypothetical protein Glove_306g80 [Diversispora epigaea]|uniref:BTB domain-containing protein n=1 Tax=Diversispora epigaea TaxID=1348612 RepID=A0A397HX92_9GLOM|nr:hypothetical protein Glove_306g80 [Diversispora epigaea]